MTHVQTKFGVITVDTSTPAHPDIERDDAIVPAVTAALVLVAPLSELRFITACFADRRP